MENNHTIFSNKNDNGTNIELAEGDENWNDDEKITEELNNFFQNAVSNLKLMNNDISNVGSPQTFPPGKIYWK